MKKNVVRTLCILIATLLTFFMFAGCSANTSKKKTVKLGYVNWSEGIAITNLAQAILQEKMGYTVETSMGDVGPVYSSVASGDFDAFLDAWLPSLQKDYADKFGDKYVEIGDIFQGTLVGLVVPNYVTIDSIDQLNANKDKFDGNIVGIDAGAGIMQSTSNAITDYGLDYKLQSGSGPVMTAELKKAIDAKKWIVVTGWQPHWMFGRWDLKFLKDPKGVYGKPEYIKAIGRKNLSKDMPDVAKFLSNLKLSGDQLNGLMSDIQSSDKDPYDVAKDWMNKNADAVNSWITSK